MRSAIFLLAMTILGGCSVDVPTSTDGTTPTQTPMSGMTSDSPTSPVESSTSPAIDDVAEETDDVAGETIVIDVRSESEWDSGHVEQAVHIPHTEIAERISEITTNKDAKIVVYCAVGGRAGKAKTSLEELGFTNVENGGGYDDVKERFN